MTRKEAMDYIMDETRKAKSAYREAHGMTNEMLRVMCHGGKAAADCLDKFLDGEIAYVNAHLRGTVPADVMAIMSMVG